MTDSYIVTRTLGIEECDWLPKTLPAGTIVYRSSEPTYGAVKDLAATFESDGSGVFFEVPYDAVVKQEEPEETPDSP